MVGRFRGEWAKCHAASALFPSLVQKHALPKQFVFCQGEGSKIEIAVAATFQIDNADAFPSHFPHPQVGRWDISNPHRNDFRKTVVVGTSFTTPSGVPNVALQRYGRVCVCNMKSMHFDIVRTLAGSTPATGSRSCEALSSQSRARREL